MSKKDTLLAIDYLKGAGTSGSSRVVGSGSGGTVDTSGFLLLDGSRAMTGNFNVGGYNVTNVNLVDGVDIAAHAANVNAHHSRQHSYDSTSDHSGTLSWNNVNKSGSNLTDIETRNHNALFFIGPDDHHNRQHSITSTSDHTITGVAFDLVGATGTNTIGILTPSENVSGGFERILKSSSSGNLNLASLTTTLIDSDGGASLEIAPGNYLVLNPTGNLVHLSSDVALQSSNYSSQTTGMRIDYAGGGDFRYLFVDEMHAKSFIADLEQALAGGQIISKSVAVLYSTFTAPAAGGSSTIVVEDLPGTTNMAVFVNGDIVRLRNFSRAGGSLSITDCWGTVTLDTTYGVNGFDSSTKTQKYNFTRSSGSNAGAMLQNDTVEKGTLVLDYGTTGNGYYEVNSIDGAYGINSPYAQIVTWTSHPATGKTTRARLGNLVGIFGGSNEYGLYAGDGGTATSSQYFRISNVGVGLYNIPLRMYTGGTQTVNISSYNDVWLGPNSSNKLLSFNGSTLSIVGDITVTGGNAATTDNIAGGTNLATNSSFEIDSNGDGLADGYNIYNNDGGSVPTVASIITESSRSPKAQRISWTGLNLTTKGIYFQPPTGKRSGVSYVLSFWARCSNSATIEFYENVPFATKTWLTSKTLSTTWTFFAVRLYWSTTPANNFYLSVQSGSAINSGWIDFDNIMLSESQYIVPYYTSFSDIITYGGRVAMPINPQYNGLYLSSTYMGYWTSSGGWRTYMDSNGTFGFIGSSGAILKWDGARLFGGTSTTFSTSTAKWYIDSTNGSFIAGSGTTWLDDDGISIKNYSGASSQTLNSLKFIDDASTNINAYIAGYNSSVTSFLAIVNAPSGKNAYITIASTGSSNGTLRLSANAGATSTYIEMTNSSINFGGSSIFGNTLRVDQTATFNGVTYFQNAIGAFGPWYNLSLFSGWSNAGSGYQTAQYRKIGDVVHLRGLVVSSSTSSNVAQLPTGYWPTAGRLIFALWTGTTNYRVDVTTSGVITCAGWTPASGNYVALDGIQFTVS